MGRRCIVVGCSVNERNQPEYVTLHRLPVDFRERGVWLDRCGVTDGNRNAYSWRVCSRHFSAMDYVVGKDGVLKTGSIPKHNLPGTATYTVRITHNSTNSNIRIPISDDVVINMQLHSNPAMRKGTASVSVNGQATSTGRVSTRTVPSALYEKLRAKFESLKGKNALLSSQLKASRAAKQRLSGSSVITKSRVVAIKQAHAIEKLKLLGRVKKVEEKSEKNLTGMKKIFTEKQIEMLVSGKKKMQWTNDEIAKSITLRYKANLYESLRTLGFPFPATRTLQDAMHGINFSPGIIYPVINLLKHVFADAPLKSKQCILSFDELSIDSSIAYYPAADQILGPKTQMNVYFIRGLIDGWKQPIAFEFDDTFCPRKFMALLKVIGDTGLCVQGIVTDLGGKNRGLFNKFNVNVRKNKEGSFTVRHQIKNPTFPDVDIQIFADLPHLLKLLRNNMINHGLKIKGDYWIRATDYERLIEVDKGDFQSAWKLTKLHLNLKGKKKQKVLPAFQTFSNTVAQLWRKVFVNRPSEAKFIALVNDFCDLLNTRCYKGITPAKKAFGLDKPAQMKILDEMEDAMIHLRVGTLYDNLYPFQRGFLMSIHSLKKLLAQISASPLDQTHILCHRLNQDIAENTFSEVRGSGGYHDNPDPVDAMNRLKRVCLGCDYSSLSTCPVQRDDSEGYLTGQMMKVLRQQISSERIEIQVELEPERMAVNELNAGNFVEVMDNLRIEQRCEEDGLEYVAGFVASKFKNTDPELRADEEELMLVQSDSWVLKLSDGRLTVPSLNWRNMCGILHGEFCQFHRGHKHRINPNRGVLKAFTRELQTKYPEIPQEPLSKFVKTIFFHRIKQANCAIKDARAERYRGRETHVMEVEDEEEYIYEEDEEDFDEIAPWEEDTEEPGRQTTEDYMVASYELYMRDEVELRDGQ